MNSTLKKTFCLILCMITIICAGLGAFTSNAAEDFTPDPNSPLAGIKVGFYGDSICAAGADKGTAYESVYGWAGRVGTKNAMKWTNHGISAYSVSNCRGEKTIYAQLKPTLKFKYEMIILHGGTNDAWDNAPIGTMTEGFGASNSYDVTTFAGGLEQLFALIRENNPDATVGYIINFKFINASKGASRKYRDENGVVKTEYVLNAMQGYVDMTKQICDKWGVPYLDLYSNDELTEKLHPKTTDANGKVTYQTTYLSDFIHPTPEGYNVIYPYVEEFLIDLVTPDPEPEPEPVVSTAPTVENEPSTEKTEQKDGGCKSFAGGSAAFICVVSLAGACIIARKKNSI